MLEIKDAMNTRNIHVEITTRTFYPRFDNELSCVIDENPLSGHECEHVDPIVLKKWQDDLDDGKLPLLRAELIDVGVPFSCYFYLQ